MYIKSPKGEKGYTLIQESGGYGVHGAMKAAGNAGVPMSAAAGEAMRASLREKNYKVCILYGEKEKVLASGITERTAKVLLEKIDSLI